MGLILPVLPGPSLILAGLFLGAWADHFTHVGVFTLSIIVLLAVGAHVVDFVAASVGTKRVGASRVAAVGAAAGTLAGLVFGFPGIIIGPFAGALLGELAVTRNLPRAGSVGLAAWLGFVIGSAIKVGLAFLMIAVFAIAVLL
jgi:uncharacterized protein